MKKMPGKYKWNKVLIELDQAFSNNYRSIRLAGIAGSIVVVGLIATTLELDRDHTFVHSENQANNLALIVQKDIARNCEIYDLSLQAMVDNWQDPSLQELSEQLKRKIVFDRSSNANNITSAIIVGVDGRVLLDLHQRDFGNLSFEGRDYFYVHKNADDIGLFVSKPFISRTNGVRTIALSRRISGKDGTFLGIALMTINSNYFRDLLSGLNLGKQGRATITTGEGTVVMSFPYDEKSIGMDGSKSDVFKRSLGAPTTTFISRSAIDNHERLFVVRTVESPAFKVMMGFSTDDIYGDWTAQAIPTISITAVFVALLLFSSAALSKQLRARKIAENKLELLAHSDSLTGLATRRALDVALEKEMARLSRNPGLDLAVVFIDVDFFKKYNDSYGHPAGDEVLKQLAAIITDTIQRPNDCAGRYGGEEFLLVLAQTDLNGAYFLADKIRRQMDMLALPHIGSPLGRVTLSAGVACVNGESADWRELIKMADAALYEAKGIGRNNVVANKNNLKPKTKIY